MHVYALLDVTYCSYATSVVSLAFNLQGTVAFPVKLFSDSVKKSAHIIVGCFVILFLYCIILSEI